MFNPGEENKNLVQLFLSRVSRYQNRPALFFKGCPSGPYLSLTWHGWGERVKQTALGLHSRGVRRGDHVAILSENRPEWTFADLGILSLGAASVPIYPTSSYREIAYIVENAGVEIIFVSNLEQWEKIKPLFQENPKLRHAILFNEAPEDHLNLRGLPALLEAGRLESLNNPGVYLESVGSVAPEDLATIIYTSGTTGPPKGVMLTHRNFVANCVGASQFIEITERDLALSFLPLSHVFERLAGYYFMAFHGAAIAYAENMQTVPSDLLTIRPTVSAAVPRFYEKMYAKILENVETGSRLKRKIFFSCVRTGRQIARKRMNQMPLSFLERFRYGLAKILVFNKLKKKLGGRLRFFISGGAPLAKELAEFFYAADVLILEGYGLTETSPVISVNSTNHFRFGTVGQPLSNVEVKIADDGEILTRGPCVMKGYYQNPAATSEAMKDGWFHTGDIGLIDSEGFLKITDRKKDIIVTSGGKNISPQNIEGLVLGDKLFSQMVVIGDKKNYLVALVTPNRAEVETYARQIGLNLPWERLLEHPAIYEWMDGRLKSRTRDLAAYEQIKYFALLPKEMTQESGELTPTLKVKRKVVMEKYSTLIETLYRKGETVKADRAAP